MPSHLPGQPGLQVERTQLSWERTALGFLVSGALVLLRPNGPLEVGRILLALSAALLALLVVWLGRRRRKRVKTIHPVTGKNIIADPRTEVYLIGCAAAIFAAAIVVLLWSEK
ncbi:hypothetical protein C6A85_000000111600 [Mycobacterium sp. ITM-2017-0098]|nr:hypothetical protein C6A85_000000111600 [Mycobacterium sp. ITM-2017-0098]